MCKSLYFVDFVITVIGLIRSVGAFTTNTWIWYLERIEEISLVFIAWFVCSNRVDDGAELGVIEVYFGIEHERVVRVEESGFICCAVD